MKRFFKDLCWSFTIAYVVIIGVGLALLTCKFFFGLLK